MGCSFVINRGRVFLARQSFLRYRFDEFAALGSFLVSNRRQRALLIGVENYLDKEQWPRVLYAESDIAAIRNSLLALGYAAQELIVLVGENATKTSVEYQLGEVAEQPFAPEDSLLVFFVGHGISHDQTNYLLCRDTRKKNVNSTSIHFSVFLNTLKESSCQNIQIYFDLSHAHSNSEEPDQRFALPLIESSLEDDLTNSKRFSCFFSGHADQDSLFSEKLKGGVWTYHLLKAFSGKVPHILNADRHLMADKLQAFLFKDIPETIRETFTSGKEQTPWHIGHNSSQFLIADLSVLPEKKTAVPRAKANEVKDVVFRNEQRVSVKKLSAFKAGFHRVPKSYDERESKFIAGLANADVEKALGEIYEQIRSHLTYTRKQIEVSPVEEGCGSIRTPDFQLTISATLDLDFTKALFVRELSEIRNAKILTNQGFLTLFNDSFEAIGLAFKTRVNVEDLIDRAEAKGLKLDYPSDCSSCSIRSTNGGVTTITSEQLKFSYTSTQPLAQLTKGLGEVIGMLPKIDTSKALPDAPRRLP
jgi:hypothetical protein